jgi:Transglycosylase SLT domain
MKPGDPVASLAILLASLTPIQRLQAETTILCNAIAQVESGQNYKAIGDGGKALGAWQIHVAAWITANQWRMKQGLNKIPRTAWQAPENQRQIAFAYLSWIKETMEKDGLKNPTIEQIYIAFGWGYMNFSAAGFDVTRAPEAKQEAAKRVANIYFELTK